MVESLHKNDTKNFWKNVRTAHNKLDGLNSCIIDNINTPQDQVNKFSSIFKCIFDDPECNKPLSNDESNIYSIEFDNKKQIFNVQDINIAINKLNVGIGPDDVHTYHLKIAQKNLDYVSANFIIYVLISNTFLEEWQREL